MFSSSLRGWGHQYLICRSGLYEFVMKIRRFISTFDNCEDRFCLLESRLADHWTFHCACLKLCKVVFVLILGSSTSNVKVDPGFHDLYEKRDL